MQVDISFYNRLRDGITASDLAVQFGCGLHGDPNVYLTGFGSLSDASRSSFGFFDGSPSRKTPAQMGVGACFMRESSLDILSDGVVGLSHAKPRYAFARACEVFFAPKRVDGPDRIDPSAHIARSAVLAPGVVVGEGATIGENVYIGPNSVIGPGVKIGANSHVGANCSFYFVHVGEGLKALSGVTVGETGFGLSSTETGFYDVPHFGRVLIGNNCTLGANMTIDRAMFGDTIIGDGNKFDNMTHIAHNCVIGKNLRMAAYSGFAGSCIIGDNVLIGGQAGVKEHTKIGNNAILMANAGIMRDVPDGEFWGGMPAKPVRAFWRELAWVSKNAKRKPNEQKDAKE